MLYFPKAINIRSLLPPIRYAGKMIAREDVKY